MEKGLAHAFQPPLIPPAGNNEHAMINVEDFAVVVGISHYASSPPVSGAASDATAFADWLTAPDLGGLPPGNVTLVVGEESVDPSAVTSRPTRSKVDEAFVLFVERGREHDGRAGRRLYIYFAGHGFRSEGLDIGFFLADSAADGSTSSIATRLYAEYAQQLFDEVVLVIDSTLSVAGTGGTASRPPWVPTSAPRRRERPGLHFYCVADRVRGTGSPAGAAGLPQGVLTRALLDGLGGDAANERGEIDAEKLGRFILARWAEYGGGDPVPLFSSDPVRRFVLRTVNPDRQETSIALPTPRIASDRWAERDALGYEPFARAVAELITNKETVPPLTIGIKAPWGAGKTTLMKRVQYFLDGEARVTEENESTRRNRSIEVTTTLRELLKGLERLGQAALRPGTAVAEGQASLDAVSPLPTAAARQAQAAERAMEAGRAGTVALATPSKEGSERGIPPRITVWFNAWKYQTSEQIWAGLGHCIISQVTARMSAADRELFWMKLHASRVDTNKLRWEARMVVLRDLVPWLLFCAVLLVSGAVLMSSPTLFVSYFGLLAIGVSPVLATARLAYGWSKKLGEKVSGGFRDLVREPEYEGKLGFLHLVESDMREVLDLVATADEPLVIFVDDLDRCAPHRIAEIIEAINLFLSGDYPNCIFVLGMEPAVVAAALEVANKDLLEKLQVFGMEDRDVPLGWRFMEKIIQLPLAIPAPTGDGAASYATHLTSTRVVGPDRAHAAPEAKAVAHYFAGLEEAGTVQTVVDRTERLLETAAPEERPAIAEAGRRAYGASFTDRDPVIVRFIAETAALLQGNPRQLKRYVNLFRFVSALRQGIVWDRAAACLPAVRMPADAVLTKLVALSIRWPQAPEFLRSKRLPAGYPRGAEVVGGLLGALEQGASALDTEQAERADERWHAYAKVLEVSDAGWLCSREFRRFLAAGEPLAPHLHCGLW